jgi:hypothetical protein
MQKNWKKIVRVFSIRQQRIDSSAINNQRYRNLIEAAHILHGFRRRSKEILTLLSRKDMATYLPYIDTSLINIKSFRSWSKAYKLIGNLFSYKKKFLG